MPLFKKCPIFSNGQASRITPKPSQSLSSKKKLARKCARAKLKNAKAEYLFRIKFIKKSYLENDSKNKSMMAQIIANSLIS